MSVSQHREGMAYALQSTTTQMELVRTVHINVYKYYFTATELLVEFKEVLDQLDAAHAEAADADCAAADGTAAAVEASSATATSAEL